MTRVATTDTPLAQRAAAHWTRERETKLTGGKRWPLLPSEAPELLRVLGLLNADATMSADRVRKFAQINHMITLLAPVLDDLRDRHAVLHIVDACCGTSSLTLMLAWLCQHAWRKPCRIVGLDANAAVIATSRDRAKRLQLQDVVRFGVGPIEAACVAGAIAANFPEAVRAPAADAPVSSEAGERAGHKLRPHLLIALHACDTATDAALAAGVAAHADVMAVAPCCHAELARRWQAVGDEAKADEHPLAPMFRAANLRRDAAAPMTDALRMLQIRAHGYEVRATEFVGAEHTPKNRLLTCVRRGNFLVSAQAEYQRMALAVVGEDLALARLLGGAPVGL
jgi:SAM-dependent methyltransferase